MEKSIPHYRLEEIQAVVAACAMDAFTATAQRGVDGMGLSAEEALAVIAALDRSMFYKSMTTYADHRVWQDVYHALCPNGLMAYIKCTRREGGVVVIQFKELSP